MYSQSVFMEPSKDSKDNDFVSNASTISKNLLRKRFYQLCIDGLCTMVDMNLMEDLEPDIDDIDYWEGHTEAARYIIDHLSLKEPSAIGLVRTWFDGVKFGRMLVDPEANEMVHRILDLFENCDVGTTNTYRESYFDTEEDQEFAKYYLANYYPNPPLGYGWYLLKRKHNFFKRWSIINFWWRVAGENQHSANGRGRIRSREEFEAECSQLL